MELNPYETRWVEPQTQPRSVQQKDVPQTCPVCGASVERRRVGKEMGWSCRIGGYAHYYQIKYGYLKQWFTSGTGNLREPVIAAMNCRGDSSYNW